CIYLNLMILIKIIRGFISVERWVGVETQGKYTQGMTIVDYYYLTDNKPNAIVMVDIDRQGFVDLLAERLKFYA
ncbi:hypothetical protein FSI45_021610, partial [Escherichia coli]|nr:hypothetical protein [Escherichia coli]